MVDEILNIVLSTPAHHRKNIAGAMEAADPDTDGSLMAEIDRRGSGDVMREMMDRIQHEVVRRRGRSRYVQGWKP